MKLQRFYIKEIHNKYGDIAMGRHFWLREDNVNHQIIKVFRAKPGYELIIFNDFEERLFRILEISYDGGIKLEMITELVRKLPKKEVYLLWCLLKRDKNDLVLQKATELGVHKFIPIISSRTEKLGFDNDRAQKIIIEAAEQCGRGDIPEIREPITIKEAIKEYADLPLFICEQHDSASITPTELAKMGILIGPEGGWTNEEKVLFKNYDFSHIAISDFTLRAETAAITAVSRLLA